MKAYIRHLIAMFATFFGTHTAMTPGAGAQDRESQEFAAAKSAGTLKAMEDYLAKNPVGRHSRDAFREIIRLSNGDTLVVPRADDIGDADPSLLDNAYPTAGPLY